MRLTLSWLLALYFLAMPVLSQNPSMTTTQSILQIEDDWLKAEQHTDPAVLERVLADDFVNLGPSGLAPGKSQLLKNFQAHAGEAPAYVVETSDMRVYLLGETAVAAYVKTYTGKESGATAREDTTHIFTKDHGVWKLRMSRSTLRSGQ
jgi:hypothetical protein